MDMQFPGQLAQDQLGRSNRLAQNSRPGLQSAHAHIIAGCEGDEPKASSRHALQLLGSPLHIASDDTTWLSIAQIRGREPEGRDRRRSGIAVVGLASALD